MELAGFTNCSLLANFTDVYNETYNCSSSPYGDSDINDPIADLILQIFYGGIFLVGLSGNTLVIYVVSRFSKMQTVTNFYILNLAISDEFYIFGVPLLMTALAYGRWPFPDLVCKMYYALTSINQFSSSLFLTIMSADRYMAVCQPISATKFRTTPISRALSLSAWALSALMVTPAVVFSSIIEIDGRSHCNIFMPTIHGVPGHILFTSYSFILSFAIPFSLILIFYALVIHKLRNIGPKKKSKDRKHSQRKVTRLVFMIVLVYLLCWLPYWVAQLMLINTESKAGHTKLVVLMFVLFSALTYINSALNPILYAFLSENFKKSFVKAFTCLGKRNERPTIQAGNSMLARRQRSKVDGGGGLSRTNLCLTTDAATGDLRNSQPPVSGDTSSALTLSSRVPHSQTSGDAPASAKNGTHLEVPPLKVNALHRA